MTFDPENIVIKLCAHGMMVESEGNMEEAADLFVQAWNKATNNFERFTAAHYVARTQKTVTDKLKWDETALNLALLLNDDNLKYCYPSLYLNIAKCYEDLLDFENSKKNYDLGLAFLHFLPENGYGKMIMSGIKAGLARITSL